MANTDPRLETAKARIQEERLRVQRLLDDIRIGLGLPIKRRTGRPVLYPITSTHAAHRVSSARAWLPNAWQAYRGAQADRRNIAGWVAERPDRAADYAHALATAAE